MDDKFLKQLGEHLPGNGAALILLVRKASEDKILPKIKVLGTIIQTSLSKK